MEAFTDTVGLGAFCLGFGMVDILNGKVLLELMMLPCTAVFGAPVCKDPQEPDIMLLIKGDHTVIQ